MYSWRDSRNAIAGNYNRRELRAPPGLAEAIHFRSAPRHAPIRSDASESRDRLQFGSSLTSAWVNQVRLLKRSPLARDANESGESIRDRRQPFCFVQAVDDAPQSLASEPILFTGPARGSGAHV